MAREKTKCVTSIGGQALIEGIMMRGPKKTAVAVRLPDKTIETEELGVTALRDRYKIFRVPIIRGLGGLIDSFRIGYKALMLSADKSGLEEEADEEPSKFDKWLERVFGDKIMGIIMGIASVLGVALAVLLFFVLPTWLFNLTTNVWPAIGEGSIYRAIFEGILRVLIFLLYLILCSRMKEIHRVFQYHGAEHKTIFCYENQEELTVENVRKHVRFHPRCGTSFMIIMLMLGIVIGFFIPFSNPFLRTAVKILCIPVVVGIGFELIKICGKYDNIVTRVISAPGLWMQRITTKEPDDEMIEVAISALKDVIPENGEDLIKK